MKTRKIVILSAVALVVLGVLAVNLFGGSEPEPKGPPPAPEGSPVASGAVRRFETMTVANDTVAFSVELTGRVQAAQSVEIFAEVQGTLERSGKSFKDGVAFSAGETMVSIDDSEYRLGLQAQKSRFISALVGAMADLKLDYPQTYERWHAYLLSLNANEPLPDLPETSEEQARFYLSARGVFEQFYTIRSQEERLAKYILRAPFDGVVTEGSADPGTLVNPQKRLGAFMRTDAFEVAAAVNLADLEYLRNTEIVFANRELPGKQWQGRLARVSKRLDPNTQRVQVYLSVSGPDLRDGMYLEGKTEGGQVEGAFRLPRAALTRSGQVYAIVDSTARLLDVQAFRYEGNDAIVGGLPDGTVVISQQVTASIEGSKVAPR